LPTYAVPTTFYLKAVVIGLGAAAICGVIMGFFPNFEFWMALLMGIAVPETVAFASNQKRSPGLQIVAIGAIFVGFAISRVVMEFFNTVDIYRRISPPPDLFRDLPVYVTQYTIIWFAIAAILAYRRLQ
jgi:hypothetical protein